MMRNFLIIALCGFGMPAAAQQVFTPPEGCTGYVTVQKNSCQVSHYFTCEMDEDGDNRRVDFNGGGFNYAGRTDSESQWIESFYPFSGSYEVLELPAIDPASFSGLVADGLDSYDFTTVDRDGVRFRFIGTDRLTGEETVIDGVTLLRTEYEIRMEDGEGEILWASRGNEFIHPDWGVFISGTGTSRVPGEDESFEDTSPVEFVFPGEPGFMSSNPKFGCGTELTSWEVN